VARFTVEIKSIPDPEGLFRMTAHIVDRKTLQLPPAAPHRHYIEETERTEDGSKLDDAATADRYPFRSRRKKRLSHLGSAGG